MRSSILASLALLTCGLAGAQGANFGHDAFSVYEDRNGNIIAADETGTYVFADWMSYHQSDFFQDHGKCGQAYVQAQEITTDPMGSQADCSNSFTNTSSEYDPSGQTFTIQVVVHVLQQKNGTGYVSPEQVQAQIDVLNEDFLAISGTNGAPGTNSRIQFALATTDPDGNASTGITYSRSNSWYNDKGAYYNELSWDTTRYLNIYTNSAGGNLGYAYVPSGGGIVGSSFDRVVIFWRAFGRNTGYAPYDLGRTATHEVGHYLGLYHTFQGGCASASGCAGNGDLICDTNPESSPNYSGCSRVSCSSSDPVKNYMDYSEDACMDNFTPDQVNRMRCTLLNFRTALWDGGGSGGNNAPTISIDSPGDGAVFSPSDSITFIGTADDAEDGSLTGSISWSSDLDGPLGTGGSVTTTLSEGLHTITASVSDSESASADDSISVLVQVPGTINLTASGFKRKGVINADLSWSGASTSTVEVYRNGALVATVPNNGSYTDNTGQKGGGSFTYQVCEPGGSCSNQATVSF